jgi:hypothetical protein
MKNAIELYESNKSWYDYLPERKFMILDFLPKCEGHTLSVGVHSFNKNDEAACNKECLYETIDIDDRCSNFGSSYKHTTVDFLDYNPNYKFDNIILFGVLGIPDGLGGYEYTLHKNESIISEKIDKILSKNGKVLLGPDIDPNSAAGENSYSTEDFWLDFIKKDNTLKERYDLETFFKGRSNLIIVLKKKKTLM